VNGRQQTLEHHKRCPWHEAFSVTLQKNRSLNCSGHEESQRGLLAHERPSSKNVIVMALGSLLFAALDQTYSIPMANETPPPVLHRVRDLQEIALHPAGRLQGLLLAPFRLCKGQGELWACHSRIFHTRLVIDGS
jgi:hypothetical protein